MICKSDLVNCFGLLCLNAPLTNVFPCFFHRFGHEVVSAVRGGPYSLSLSLSRSQLVLRNLRAHVVNAPSYPSPHSLSPALALTLTHRD